MFLYALAILLLIVSVYKDRDKTKRGIQKGHLDDAWGTALFPDHHAGYRHGPYSSEAGYHQADGGRVRPSGNDNRLGRYGRSCTGSGRIPNGVELLRNGAGTAQMAIFILSTLTTVGFITTLEIKYLGVKAAVPPKHPVLPGGIRHFVSSGVML